MNSTWLKMISLQEWEDVNLAWNTSEYGNVEDVRIPPSALWKPDILMYNRYAINATWSLSDTQYLACHKMSLNLSNLPDSYVLQLLMRNVLSFRCAFWSHDGFLSPVGRVHRYKSSRELFEFSDAAFPLCEHVRKLPLPQISQRGYFGVVCL